MYLIPIYYVVEASRNFKFQPNYIMVRASLCIVQTNYLVGCVGNYKCILRLKIEKFESIDKLVDYFCLAATFFYYLHDIIYRHHDNVFPTVHFFLRSLPPLLYYIILLYYIYILYYIILLYYMIYYIILYFMYAS